ncbi:WD40 repeat-like protein [Piedraia hortae CBS 480.64]|uniref:WD40 repeat-like protein n=1 Tax=Piedraia hortae CBS 480.64 TaxID=1314780 RepID=A0A6A7C0B1_9PEZI|nr:WD40 repeat-like protein [Piedraia hortae CBS 480.64]
MSHDEEDVMRMEDAEEEVAPEDSGDEDMDMDDEDNDDSDQEMEEEYTGPDDSIARFTHHKSSVFCIAQHPKVPDIMATGGGDDIGYVWSSAPKEGNNGESQDIIAALEHQTESVNAICFLEPHGDFIVTGSLSGKINIYITPKDIFPTGLFISSMLETREVIWMHACPHGQHPYVFAVGAEDGTVWIYGLTPEQTTGILHILRTYNQHTDSCTAGAWSPDGKMLATVSNDSSLYIHDAFGDCCAGRTIVSMTGKDERFRVEDGFLSVAFSPGGGFVAVGGADGTIRIVGLPPPGTLRAGKFDPKTAGTLRTSFRYQSDGIETLDFSQPPQCLLAAGSLDGSIVVLDTSRNFNVRRQIRAHEDEAVVKVEFVKTYPGTSNPRSWQLTSCGHDGVVRRWDTRASNSVGMIGEWRGHRPGNERTGGVLDFVQFPDKIVTAGDDGKALVFKVEDGLSK